MLKTLVVNGEQYRRRITQYFWHEIEDINLEDMCFQQDGETTRVFVKSSEVAFLHVTVTSQRLWVF